MPNDSILDAHLDYGNLADLEAGGAVTWSNLASGELTSEVLIIGTDVKAGTLTDNQICTWDDGNSQIVCNTASVGDGVSNWQYTLAKTALTPTSTVGLIINFASSTFKYITGNLLGTASSSQDLTCTDCINATETLSSIVQPASLPVQPNSP